MKKVLIGVMAAVALALGFGWGHWFANRGKADEAAQSGERKILYWHDPMHPSYRSDKPGIAPDCGMRLEPVYADDAPAGGGAAQTAAPAPGMVNINAQQQQLIGVTYGVVEPYQGEHAIRAVGRVAWDETRISRVTSRFEGWAENVFVEITGAPVRQGQPLLTVYSPELLASQQEYLLALRSTTLLAGSTVPGVDTRTNSLIEASRRRLELFGMSPAQIEQVRKTGNPIRNVTVHSPVSGIVTERKVFPKSRVSPEMELYTLADLSRVWVIADVFEFEAPNVRVGMPATVTIPGTGTRVQARVQQILPQVEATTRTLKVRLELPNPGQRLRPDMFVDVDMRVAQTASLSVPSQAVLDTGVKKTVYVDKGNGVLEPRQVETGARFGDRVEIVSGLAAGERIVTSGNFLIDSESQMKAAAAPPAADVPPAKQPTAAPPPAAADPHAGHGGHQH